jgi:hypothetical protein
MFSRPFMKIKTRLRILVDSSSVDQALSSAGRRSVALLKYHDSLLLEFIRTPETVENKDLREIVEFQKRYNVDGSLYSIEIPVEKSKSQYFFRHGVGQIEEVGKIVCKKELPSADEKKAVELVFIQATLNLHDELGILMTENIFLLENRLWFESHFPGRILNIMSIEEAAEVVDLLLKYNGTYSISDHFTVNKGYWYWLSFRTKIPFYHVDRRTTPFERPILDEFAQKFVFLLMSADEMGYQYYSGVNNDTMDSTTYHFNYYISLVTGIFDSLAIHTKNRYGLVFKDSNNPSRTSLRSEIGKRFLQALEKENLDLRKHINDHVHFVKAIYLLRELVVHREGLQQSGFESNGWKANFLEIPNELINLLKQCGDKQEKYEPWTKFGVYGNAFLEPFKFAKSGALLLSEFCNKYLQLLGFSSFLAEMEKNKPNDDFIQTVSLFESDNLGL